MMHQLRAYIQAHCSALKLGFRNLSIAPTASLLTIAAIGLCLSLPFCLIYFTKNIQNLASAWNDGTSITLYVNARSTPEQMNHIGQTAKRFAFVEDITILSADNALREFEAISGLHNSLALLPENPLPAVIHVRLNTVSVSEPQWASFKQQLKKIPQVEKIDFDQAWSQKLQTCLSFGKALAAFLYAIVGFGVLFVIGNTIRLSLEQHREEMEVLQLIGATKAFIRRPFLYRGALYGCLGGIVAATILSLTLLFFRLPAIELAALFGCVFSFEYLSFGDALTIIGISAWLGWIGAWIAFLQQHSALQYRLSNIY